MKTLTKEQKENFDLIVKEALGLNLDDTLYPEEKLEDDLGCDSLDLLDIILGVEDEFQINVIDDEAEKVVTMQDAYNLLANLL